MLRHADLPQPAQQYDTMRCTPWSSSYLLRGRPQKRQNLSIVVQAQRGDHTVLLQRLTQKQYQLLLCGCVPGCHVAATQALPAGTALVC